MIDAIALSDRIYAWFEEHREEMTRDICTMIRIPSTEGVHSAEYPFGEDCFRAVEKAMELAERFGLETSIYKNMVGQASFRKGNADFGVWAHSDVVPVSGVWTDPPFEPVVRDGRIYGRGATDNKGQLVTSLYAFRCLKELGLEPKRNAAVFVGSNEETGMADVKGWLEEHREPFFNLVPDADYSIGYAEKGSFRFWLEGDAGQDGLLALESGSALNIFPGEASAVFASGAVDPGALAKLHGLGAEYHADGDTVTVTAHGKGGHSSTAPGSDNPIAGLLAALDQAGVVKGGLSARLKFIGAVCRDDSGDILGVKCSDGVVGSLHLAGTLLRCKDGALRLGCDIRHPAAYDAESLLDVIAHTAAKAGFSVVIDKINPSKYSDPNDPGAQACAELYNTLAPKYGRSEGKPFTLSGGTYARHFTRGYGFGMAAGGNFHNADEFVRIDSLLFGGMLYALCLLRLDSLYPEADGLCNACGRSTE